MESADFISRLLDVIEHDVVPMTARGVAQGNKLFGVRNDDGELLPVCSDDSGIDIIASKRACAGPAVSIAGQDHNVFVHENLHQQVISNIEHNMNKLKKSNRSN